MTIDRTETMRVLREGNVPDSLIGAAFGISKQRVGHILGPHKHADAVERFVNGCVDVDLPDYLRAWRRRRGVSQAAAAAIIGADPTTWAHWESGVTGCSLPVLLVRYLDMLEKSEETEK